MTYICILCGKKPAKFGTFRNDKPSFCKTCKNKDMVSVKNRPVCETEGCCKQPSFGFPGQKPVFCFDHKKIGMMNLLTRLCISCNKKRAAFAKQESTEPSHCVACKTEDMVRCATPQTICKAEGCFKQTSFGFPGQKKMTCSIHKETGMVNLKHKTKADKDTMLSNLLVASKHF